MRLRKKIQIIKRNIIVDSRGYFVKVLTGTEKGLLNSPGEIYITMANPGKSRGGHYHDLATEWFTIIKGKATLQIEDVRTNERIDIYLNSKEPNTIMIPPHIAHIFCNYSSEDFLLMAYSNMLYDPKDTISYQLKNS
jgi:dTDP-4-dehydrorhamnose 3,5-epimerase-like enzyme